jgi:hypothetical protein
MGNRMKRFLIAAAAACLATSAHGQGTYYGPTFSPTQLYVQSFGPATGTQASTFDHHQIFCSNENFSVTGGNHGNCLEMFYGFGGANSSGARAGLFITLQLQSQPTTSAPFFEAATILGQALATAGGTGTTTGTALGAMEGLQAFAQLGNGATNYSSVVGVESTVQILTGGSSLARHGISLVSQGNLNAATNGAVTEDDAVHIGAGGSGTAQWINGIYFSHWNGLAPLTTGGCILCTDSSADTITTGIDFHTYTVSGNSLALPNFTVTGAGTVSSKRFLGQTSTPTANACTGFALGTGSTDAAGRVTFTSGTACSITFGTTFTNTPFCVVSPGNALSTVEAAASTTGLAVTFGSANASWQYVCFGS